MTVKNETRILKSGVEGEQAAKAAGHVVEFSRLSVGDANGNLPRLTYERTALDNHITDGNIVSDKVDTNDAEQRILILRIAPSHNYQARELLIYASANGVEFPHTYVRLGSPYPIRKPELGGVQVSIETYIKISPTTNFAIRVKPGLDFITRDQFDNHKHTPDEIGALAKNNGNVLIKPIQAAHGSLTINGQHGGWAGIHFGDFNKTLMANDLDVGFYNHVNQSWLYRFRNGVLINGTVPASQLTGMDKYYATDNKQNSIDSFTETADKLGKHLNANNKEINYLNQIHFNGGTYFEDAGANYVNFKVGLSAPYGGIRMLANNGQTTGYVYSDNNLNFGLAHKDSGWAFKVKPDLNVEVWAGNGNRLDINSNSIDAKVPLHDRGQLVYSPHNKPSPQNIGALAQDSDRGAIVAERYLTAATIQTAIKIRLPFNTNSGKMVSFCVRVYQNYKPSNINFAGYLYTATNQWNSPSATLESGIGDIDVKMGRDNDGRAYVLITSGSANNYTGVAVCNVVGGYVNANWNDGWEILRSDDAPNVVYSGTLSPPYSKHNKQNSIDSLDSTHDAMGKHLRANGNQIKDVGNIEFSNYGHGMVGLYSDTRWQQVFAMGAAYKSATDGSNINGSYGLYFTHSNNADPQARKIQGHQLNVVVNGETRSAMGDHLWTKGDISCQEGQIREGGQRVYSPNNKQNSIDSFDATYDTLGKHLHANNKNINFVNQLHFNNNVFFNASGAYVSLKSNQDSAGIKLLTKTEQTAGYLYCDHLRNAGLLSSVGKWSVKIDAASNIDLFAADRLQFQIRDGYVNAVNQLRENGQRVYSPNNLPQQLLANGGVKTDKRFFDNNVTGEGGLVGNYSTQHTDDKIIWTIGQQWVTHETHYGLGYQYGNQIDGVDRHQFVLKNNGTVHTRFGLNGGIRTDGKIIGTGDIQGFQTSDVKLKCNFSFLNTDLNLFKSLFFGHYKKRVRGTNGQPDTFIEETGGIAQQLQKLGLKNFVRTNDDGDLVLKQGGFEMVAYNLAISQKLLGIIEKQGRDMQEMSNRINQLESTS